MSVLETLVYTDAALADTRAPSTKQIDTLRNMLAERSIAGAMQPRTMTAGREMYAWLDKIARTDGKGRSAKKAPAVDDTTTQRIDALEDRVLVLTVALATLTAKLDALVKPAPRKRTPKAPKAVADVKPAA